LGTAEIPREATGPIYSRFLSRAGYQSKRIFRPAAIRPKRTLFPGYLPALCPPGRGGRLTRWGPIEVLGGGRGAPALGRRGNSGGNKGGTPKKVFTLVPICRFVPGSPKKNARPSLGSKKRWHRDFPLGGGGGNILKTQNWTQWGRGEKKKLHKQES